MNILDLPEESLLEICSYITFVQDLLRLEVACKRFKSLAFDVARDLYINYEDPITVIKNLLSRDLRHLKKLSFCSPRVDKETNWIIERLTVLSKLHNLKQLKLQFNYSGNQQQWIKEFSDLRQTIQKMTWLEKLEYQYPIIEDLGDMFANHNRLTKLVISSYTNNDIIEVPYKAFGFDKLTQVKYLALPLDVTDPLFREIVQLTNLTALDMSYANISVAMARNLTQMTNLEQINICGLDRMVVNWKLLQSLPKLTSLIDDIDVIVQQEAFQELNQLTQLTHLDLACDGLAPQKISNLTNLQVISCNVASSSVNFACFNKLTRLNLSDLYLTYKDYLRVDQIHLPRGLKYLDLPLEINTAVFNEIVKIDSLESLSVSYNSSNNEELQISRLTNLKFLEFLTKLPREIGHSLKLLPWLRKLRLDEVYEEYIEDLELLTQLNRLEVKGLAVDLNTLRQRLPFAVYAL